MTGDASVNFDLLSLSDAERLDRACDRFEGSWRAGEWPCVEAYLDAVPDSVRRVLLTELVKVELELRRGVGEHPKAAEYALRFPELRETIDQFFGGDRTGAAAQTTFPENGPPPTGEAPTVDQATFVEDPENPESLPLIDGALGRQVGDYLLLDRIGHGGMGVVYRALQRGTRRIVALKLIKADWRGDSTAVSSTRAEKRFTDEAKAHAALDHENIVPLYDAGHAVGLLYFSMRLIKGRSLAQILLSDGPPPPRRAAYYIEAVARAVQYAHDHNILHRDLKPGNIMIDGDDRPILIDLGLAKSLEATDFTSLSGKVLGTAEYMSPEQAQGRSDVDHSTDVYGLGATLFALLTGRPPFTGESGVVALRKVIDEEPEWPRSSDRVVDKELKAICLKCLEKDRGERFPSAAALAKTLRDYLEYRPTGITTPSPWARLEKWVRRKPWRAAAAALGAVAVVILAGAVAWHARQSRAQARLLVRDVLTLPFLQLPDKLAQLSRVRWWADPLLRAAKSQAAGDADHEFRLAVALLGGDPAQAPEIARRLLDAGPDQHHVATTILKAHWSAISPILFQVLDDPGSTNERRARAAAALIALDGPSTPAGRAYAELKLVPDPERRMTLLDFLVASKVDPKILAARLAIEPDASIERLLVQAIADLATPDLSADLIARFVALYRDHPDAGVHSNLARLLRRAGSAEIVERIDQSMKGLAPERRRWLVTSWGETMAIIGGGDDPIPATPQVAKTPPRFAIAVAETRLEDYRAFDPDHPERRKRHGATNPWQADLPADFVSYNDAAAYCNWRTIQDGLPASECCYSADAGPKQIRSLVPEHATRRGYRLPSLEEWETAARAGTTTGRYFAADMSRYRDNAWAHANTNFHAEPVALLHPNDYGLFDAIGNLSEWCYNPIPPHSLSCQCVAGAVGGGFCETIRYVSQRGGCFYFSDTALVARPKHDLLDRLYAWELYSYTGFRVARSLP